MSQYRCLLAVVAVLSTVSMVAAARTQSMHTTRIEPLRQLRVLAYWRFLIRLSQNHMLRHTKTCTRTSM